MLYPNIQLRRGIEIDIVYSFSSKIIFTLGLDRPLALWNNEFLHHTKGIVASVIIKNVSDGVFVKQETYT